MNKIVEQVKQIAREAGLSQDQAIKILAAARAQSR